MPWNCTVCTFNNSRDRAAQCEMCESKREVNCASGTEPALTTDKDSPSKKSLRQQSLFGWTGGSAASAPKEEESNVKSKASRKRKVQDSSLTTTTITTTMTKAPASKSRHCSSWQPTSTATTNLSANFEKLWQRAKVLRREIFSISKLRNQQPKAVQCALKGQHQIVVMATGGGKSLCYQLPATVIGGTTIVISPLIALMQDQVHSLHQKGVPAAHISSANTKKHNDQVLERLLGRPIEKKTSSKKQQEEIKNYEPITLLYCTPELVQTDHFQKVLKEMYDNHRLALIAVDEAHCLSTWGHDFRKAYRRLNILRTRFPDIPCIACTATATPKVIQDIRETLHLQDSPCHVGSFDRDNIFYKVRFKESLDAVDAQGAMKNLVNFIQKKHTECQKANSPCSGIVYVHKRQDTTLLANRINQTIRGVRAAAYSAGLKDAERTQVQQQWTTGEIDVVIATVAFGMGIDLAHVRYVIHWSISKTVEAFYQESGRAGRDGLPSVSLVYFSREEANKFAYLLRQQKEQRQEKNQKQDIEKMGKDLQALEKMVDYCVTPTCRRKYLLKHFGQDVSSTACPKACDFCANPQAVRKAIQASSAMKSVMTQHKQRKKANKVWDGQWKKPHGDDDDVVDYASDNSLDKRKASSDLALTSYDSNKTISSFSRAKSGMASSILAKYEVMECRENDSGSTAPGGGFVRFRDKVNRNADDGNTTRQSNDGIKIPEHIAAKLAASMKASATSKSDIPREKKKTSADHASKANRLREELAQLKAQQESARLKILGKTTTTTTSTSVATAPPPPPPTLTFRRKRKS